MAKVEGQRREDGKCPCGALWQGDPGASEQGQGSERHGATTGERSSHRGYVVRENEHGLRGLASDLSVTIYWAWTPATDWSCAAHPQRGDDNEIHLLGHWEN